MEDWMIGGLETATTKANGWIATAVVPPRNDKKRLVLKTQVFFKWLRGQDLNLRPSGYEPDELPGCSTPRFPVTDI